MFKRRGQRAIAAQAKRQLKAAVEAEYARFLDLKTWKGSLRKDPPRLEVILSETRGGMGFSEANESEAGRIQVRVAPQTRTGDLQLLLIHELAHAADDRLNKARYRKRRVRGGWVQHVRGVHDTHFQILLRDAAVEVFGAELDLPPGRAGYGLDQRLQAELIAESFAART